MDPKLVCKIEVRETSGQVKRGTGYIIAPDRVITAAHVVRDAADSPDAIQLYCGEGPKRSLVGGACAVLWNGQLEPTPVDVAVLECSLPPHLIPRDLVLLHGRLPQPVLWHASGFSTAAREWQQDAIHTYYGEMPVVAEHNGETSVDCTNGPRPTVDATEAELWGGVSGSSIFEKAGSQRLLAVVTHFVGGKLLPSLLVVPLPHLLTRPRFCEAISFDPEVNRRNAYRRLSLPQKLIAARTYRKCVRPLLLGLVIACALWCLGTQLARPVHSDVTEADLLRTMKKQTGDARSRLPNAVRDLDLPGKQVTWTGTHDLGSVQAGYIQIQLGPACYASFTLYDSPLATADEPTGETLTLIGTVSRTTEITVRLEDARLDGDWTRARLAWPLCCLLIAMSCACAHELVVRLRARSRVRQVANDYSACSCNGGTEFLS
jgi:hypothetical protein